MTHKHILLQLNDGISDTTPEVVEEVKKLQQYLKDWGSLLINVSIDGKFGHQTDETVKLFQQKHSLEKDGKVGKNTWAALLKVSSSEVEILPRSSVAVPSKFSGNKGIVFQELKKNGFSNVQCAAIMGCWQQESSFNPYAQELPPGTGL